MSEPTSGRFDPESIRFRVSEDPNADSSDIEVIERIGHGGMGAVYKAVQVRLNRTIALKILPPMEGVEGEIFRQRFQREAQALATLDHPNIVAVYDYGVSGDGMDFLAMEYVDGWDLMDVLRSTDEPLEEDWVYTCAKRVCDALIYAHAQGIVHRDIKPNNVLISSSGEVKVVDFGLAKVVNLTENEAMLTMSGIGMGTLDYAAPEQMIESAQVDHRADIYSLGVTVYQLLTRKLPRGAFFPPSVERHGLDPKIDHILMKAMAEDREERYQRVDLMLEDLRGLSKHHTGPVLIMGAMADKNRGAEGPIGSSYGSRVREELIRKRTLLNRRNRRRRILFSGVAMILVAICTIYYVYGGKLRPDGRKSFAYPNQTASAEPKDSSGLFPLRIDGHGKELTMYAWDGSSATDVGKGMGALPSKLENVVSLARNSCGLLTSDVQHGLAILDDGSLRSWGDNSFGQAEIPPNLGRVVEAAVGSLHSVVLLEDGTVRAWGESTVAKVPENLPRATSISAGLRHTAAILWNGEVAVWGENGLGQLDIPVRIGKAVAVSCGDNHTMVLSSDGRVKAWGDNQSGQCEVPGALRDVLAVCALANGSWCYDRNGSLRGWGDADGPAEKGPGSRYLDRFITNGRINPGAVLLAGGSPRRGERFSLETESDALRLLEKAQDFAVGRYQLLALVDPVRIVETSTPSLVRTVDADSAPVPERQPAAKTIMEVAGPEPDPKPESMGGGERPGALLVAGDRFLEMDALFKKRFAEEVEEVFRESLNDLDQNYIANLKRESEKAAGAGNTEERDLLDAEIRRHEAGGGLPSAVEKGASRTLERAAKIYRGELSKYLNRYREGARTRVADYRMTLDALQAEMIREGSLGQALAVRKIRDTIESRYLRLPALVGGGEAGSPAAQFVRIEVAGEGKKLVLAEVEVYSNGQNVALQGMAQQSSDAGETRDAGRAIDGNTSSKSEDESLSITTIQQSPWWRVDLRETCRIDSVIVHSRKEDAGRLDGMMISLLDKEGQIISKSELLPGLQRPLALIFGDDRKAFSNLAMLPDYRTYRVFFTEGSGTTGSGIAFSETRKIFDLVADEIRHPRFGQSFENTIGTQLLGVEPGMFYKGDNGESSEQQVVLTHGFWLGKFEVTRKEWQKLMGDLDVTYLTQNTEPKGDDFPIMHLWSNQIREFCSRLTKEEHGRNLIPPDFEYTLPTEAQWHYSCRAGTTGPIYAAKYDEIAWPVVEASRGVAANRVGGKKPNPWGFHDMVGNVGELLRDPPSDHVYGLLFNPVGGFSPLGIDGTSMDRYVIAGIGSTISDWHWNTGLTPEADPNQIYNGGALGFRLALVPKNSIQPDLCEIIPKIEDYVSGRKWDECFALLDSLSERAESDCFPQVLRQTAMVGDLVSFARSGFRRDSMPAASQERLETGQQYLFVPIPMTWEEGETFARSFGAHLVTIGSEEELEFVRQKVPGGQGYCWLGASGRRNWNWITKEEWGYSNWADRQPDNLQDWARRFSVCMRLDPEGKWFDVAPEEKLPIIMEWEAESNR